MKRKIVVCLILILLVISIFTNQIIASGSPQSGKGLVMHYFNGSLNGSENAVNSATNILSSILKIVRVSGVTTAVIILMVIGIKYMIASAGDRADIKKYAIKYIIGAIVLFAASGIAGIIQSFVKENIKPND